MKKIFFLIISLISLTLILSGCESGDTDTDKIKIVATIFPQYDFCRNIAGDNANITMLLSPGAETHSYEPTPKDIKAIQDCDIFIYVGGESDSWIDGILESLDANKIKIISLMDIAEPIEEDAHDDEHVWTSPANAIKICREIAFAMCEADPENTEIYNKNCVEYIEKLSALDNQFAEITSDAKRKLLIFGDRFPLLYFVRQYGLEYRSAYPGCSDNTEPSASVIAQLIDTVKEEGIPVIFKIELSNGNIAEIVSEATGAKVLTFYSCHNISKNDFNNNESYLSLMTKNLESLKEALN